LRPRPAGSGDADPAQHILAAEPAHAEATLNAMRGRDIETIFAEPNSMFRSDTSETKNWITVAGIMSSTGFAIELLDYVPFYRSDAGTGNAMAFATLS
jgi:hypothetical protein